MESEASEIRFKMILFGSEAVGKTSLVDRFVNDKFEHSYLSTLGYNVYEKLVSHGKLVISLLIYDIGGQERFRELRRKYAEGAHLAFIVFDVTNVDSYKMVQDWKVDLFEFAGEIPFILVGNKADLGQERQIARDDAVKLSSDLGAHTYLETSAKTGEGVEAAFTQLAQHTYKIRFE